jgi:CelD/BcsL family acetyltransferase involved in cellulose biosynthesis
MNRISAEIIDDFGALESLEPEWWDLWRRCPGALPFQAPAWLMPWWRHFAPGSLFVLAARNSGRLVGLAPAYIEDGALGRRILPLGISLSDHLDILVDPDCAEPAMASLVSAALSRSGDWDIWELENLLPDAVALRLRLPHGCVDQVVAQTACPVLALSRGQDGAPPPLPRAKRRHLNLACNRAARRGAVVIERAGATSVIPALEHLFRLHGKRWESRGGAGVLAPEPVQAFQRDAVPRLQASGLLRVYLLRIADQVVAAHYELVHGRRVYVYLTGLDPDYEYESPSTILMAHAIEQAIGDGFSEIDFLRGQEPYKYEWGAVDRWNVKRSIRRADHG